MNSKLITLSCLFVLVTGCGQKDRTYYEANLDDARVKAEECESFLKTAFEEGNEQKLKEYTENSECKFATGVHKFQTQKLANLKLKMEQEASQKAFEQEYKDHFSKQQKMTYDEYLIVLNECYGNIKTIGSPKCKANHKLRKEQEAKEISSLIASYSGAELKASYKESCSGMNFNKPRCKVSKEAIRQQEKNKIEHYLANHDLLKNHFNECRTERKILTKKQKWMEKLKLEQSFKCYTAKQAAAKLNIRSFRNPIL